MINQAIILAGGKGTRLRERLGDLPKPLIDVCGKPLLERQIELLIRHGFDDVVVLVNHQAEKISEFCDSRNNWGIKVRCIDDGVPRGTAGAVLAILEYLKSSFLVVYGDTLIGVDLRRFCNFHFEGVPADASLFLHPNDHPHDSDLVEMDKDGWITSFHPYPHPEDTYYQNLVNAALYCVEKESLVRLNYCGDGPLDFGKDLFPAMISSGFKLKGYNSPEYIKDCGTPSRLDRACLDLEAGKVSRSSLDTPQSAVFIDRDGTINTAVGHLSDVDTFTLMPGVAAGIRMLNKADFRTCVVTNQPVIARGELSFSGLSHIHNKMETLLGNEGAYVDRIYYCPHHPDSGFGGEMRELKRECDCRKPNVGMIIQASIELNIDLGRSWLIGDTSVDIMTANRAGLQSILVRTGEAGLDNKYDSVPDFIVNDLHHAAHLITVILPSVGDQLEKIPFKALSCRNIQIVGPQAPAEIVFSFLLLLRRQGKIESNKNISLRNKSEMNTVVEPENTITINADYSGEVTPEIDHSFGSPYHIFVPSLGESYDYQ